MNSLFSVFDPVLFIIGPLLEVQKLIVFFMLLQAFIFTVKNILFSGWKSPEFFEVLQKSDDREVKDYAIKVGERRPEIWLSIDA